MINNIFFTGIRKIHDKDNQDSKNNQDTITNDMATLGNICNTDKTYHHGYQRFYPKYIDSYRNKVGSMLEIGIGMTIENKYSVNLWLEYFPKAFIYGIDINFADEGKRFKIFKADQSLITDLEFVKNQINEQLFLIIDDGSHIPDHQVLTFDYYFDSLLAPGGTYIIEDIETSYWTKNGIYSYPTKYGYRNEKSTVEIFKCLVDDINNDYLHKENKNKQTDIINPYIKNKETRNWISSIIFAQNCIIIVKKTDEEKKLFDNRKYNFEQNL